MPETILRSAGPTTRRKTSAFSVPAINPWRSKRSRQRHLSPRMKIDGHRIVPERVRTNSSIENEHMAEPRPRAREPTRRPRNSGATVPPVFPRNFRGSRPVVKPNTAADIPAAYPAVTQDRCTAARFHTGRRRQTFPGVDERSLQGPRACARGSLSGSVIRRFEFWGFSGGQAQPHRFLA